MKKAFFALRYVRPKFRIASTEAEKEIQFRRLPVENYENAQFLNGVC